MERHIGCELKVKYSDGEDSVLDGFNCYFNGALVYHVTYEEAAARYGVCLRSDELADMILKDAERSVASMELYGDNGQVAGITVPKQLGEGATEDDG